MPKTKIIYKELSYKVELASKKITFDSQKKYPVIYKENNKRFFL